MSNCSMKSSDFASVKSTDEKSIKSENETGSNNGKKVIIHELSESNISKLPKVSTKEVIQRDNKGICKFFCSKAGYGFVQGVASTPEIMIKKGSIVGNLPIVGDRLIYDVEYDKATKKTLAINVKGGTSDKTEKNMKEGKLFATMKRDKIRKPIEKNENWKESMQKLDKFKDVEPTVKSYVKFEKKNKKGEKSKKEVEKRKGKNSIKLCDILPKTKNPSYDGKNINLLKRKQSPTSLRIAADKAISASVPDPYDTRFLLRDGNCPYSLSPRSRHELYVNKHNISYSSNDLYGNGKALTDVPLCEVSYYPTRLSTGVSAPAYYDEYIRQSRIGHEPHYGQRYNDHMSMLHETRELEPYVPLHEQHDYTSSSFSSRGYRSAPSISSGKAQSTLTASTMGSSLSSRHNISNAESHILKGEALRSRGMVRDPEYSYYGVPSETYYPHSVPKREIDYPIDRRIKY